MDELEILANSRARKEDDQVRSNLAMRVRLATAALFLVCLFAFPCFCFLLIAVGIAPLSAMIGLTVQGLSAPGSDASPLGWLSLANVVVWGVAVFAICRWAVRAIYGSNMKSADIAVGVLILATAAIGLLPFYWIAGHGTPVGESAYELFFQTATGRYR